MLPVCHIEGGHHRGRSGSQGAFVGGDQEKLGSTRFGLVMFMEHTGLEGSHQSDRVEKYHIARHVWTKSDPHWFCLDFSWIPMEKVEEDNEESLA